MEFLLGIFLFCLFIDITVVVAAIGIHWYDSGSAIEFSTCFLNALQGDWIWPGVPIAHHLIDAATVALNIDTSSSFPMFSWMTSLYGSVLAVFINIAGVMMMLWIVVACTHKVSLLFRWLWKRFKKLQPPDQTL